MTGRRSTSLVMALATSTSLPPARRTTGSTPGRLRWRRCHTAVIEDVTIEIATRRLAAETGEPIELMVTIKAPPAAGARLVLPEDGRLGDFDVLSWERAEQRPGCPGHRGKTTNSGLDV